MSKKELTATCDVIIGDTVKPLEELSDDERAQMLSNMKRRLSQSMSMYFSNHLNEYRAFVGT